MKSSGAEPPAAMRVEPATSGEIPNFSMMTSSEGTKKWSQTSANARNMYNTPVNIDYCSPFYDASNSFMTGDLFPHSLTPGHDFPTNILIFVVRHKYLSVHLLSK